MPFFPCLEGETWKRCNQSIQWCDKKMTTQQLYHLSSMRKTASVRKKAVCAHMCTHAHTQFQGSAKQLVRQLCKFSKNIYSKSESIFAIPSGDRLFKTAVMFQATKTNPFWLSSLKTGKTEEEGTVPGALQRCTGTCGSQRGLRAAPRH